MGLIDRYGLNTPPGGVPWNFEDYGPLNNEPEIMEELFEQFGALIRIVEAADRQVTAVVVASIVEASVKVGQFTPAQIANLVAEVLINKGDYHRRQFC